MAAFKYRAAIPRPDMVIHAATMAIALLAILWSRLHPHRWADRAPPARLPV